MQTDFWSEMVIGYSGPRRQELACKRIISGVRPGLVLWMESKTSPAGWVVSEPHPHAEGYFAQLAWVCFLVI